MFVIIEQATLEVFQVTIESIHLEKQDGQKAVNSLHSFRLRLVCFFVVLFVVCLFLYVLFLLFELLMNSELHRQPALRRILNTIWIHKSL